MTATLSFASSFCKKMTEWLTLVEEWLTPPEDHVQLEQWLASAEELADSYEFTPHEEVQIDLIVGYYEQQFRERLQQRTLRSPSASDLPSLAVLDELLHRKQTEQRTEAWYRQMSEVISASEIGQLFAAPRQRAKLVLSKTQPYQPRHAPLAVYSDRMTAFDWGIRFEPVVKQIYEEKYGVVIKELGRLAHPTQPTCMASPDGLVYQCPKDERTGRLVEIKCPVTRVIDGTIPKDYYTQMQLQLHVTGLKRCDYVEAEFASLYGQTEPKQGPTFYSGMIALVYCAPPPPPAPHLSPPLPADVSMEDQKEVTVLSTPGRFEYRYSPIQAGAEWEPMLAEGEEVVEYIPWRLMRWNEQLVVRNEEWWDALQPILRTFWEDVERAKRGEFVIPESTRPAKKPKTMTNDSSASSGCLIQFHRLDEEGHSAFAS